MEATKRIALVAHDNRKKDLIEWSEWNYGILIKHRLVSTGTTGRLVEEAIKKKLSEDEARDFSVMKLKSGPLGGDQQIGAMIADGEIDLIIFLWDPMQPQPHDVDVKALLRIAVLYNIPTACNRSTADFLISSPLIDEAYEPALKDYSAYIQRNLGDDKT
ncbi:MAG: methylglyoxal synthase [Thermodesulfobacteriota bacterium]